MAVRVWAVVEPPSPNAGVPGVRVIKWTGLLNGDSGEPYLAPQYSGKVVQITGTAGVGGVCIIEGSLEPGTPIYGPLNDPQGVAISFDATEIGANDFNQILEDCYQIRPRVTAGDGATSLTVYLMINTTARR